MHSHPATIALLIAFAAAAAAQPPRQVTIYDQLYSGDGAALTSNLVITWPAFESIDGHLIPAGSKPYAIAGGLLQLSLLPTPNAVAYKVEWFPGKTTTGLRTVEYWSVPDLRTCRLQDVTRSSTPFAPPPPPPALLLLSQLDRGGALTGHVLTWGGAAWIPQAPSQGSGNCPAPYTATLASVTAITIPPETHGLGSTPAHVDCHDAQTPAHLVEPDTITVDTLGTVTITFAVAQSGSCTLHR